MKLWQVAGLASLAAMSILVSAASSAPATRPASSPATKPADLGVGASLNGNRMFPKDNPWNRDISADPVDPNSARLVASIGENKPLHPDFGPDNGIPYVVVGGGQPKVEVQFEYPGESDKGPYPVPTDAPIEGGPKAEGDRHVLVLDRDHWKLFELYAAVPLDGGKKWKAGSGAVFDLKSNALRPAGWTSADAAGLPILPGLVRYDEAAAKEITHAIRFTAVKTRRAYVPPATHFASRDKSADLPPMGMRVRLKASYDISRFDPRAQVILAALKKYGMILADNGGDWFITGAPDKRWNDDILNTLKKVKGRDFEVVKMGKVVTK